MINQHIRLLVPVLACGALTVSLPAGGQEGKKGVETLSYRILWPGGADALKDPARDFETLHQRCRGDEVVVQVGRILISGLNRRRQARGVEARLSRSAVTAGPAQPVDGRIRPPGWEDDKGLTRLMLLPYKLGGSGLDARNLVAVHRATVVPKFNAVVDRIHHAIVKRGATVEFRVTPEYRGGGRPVALVIKANTPIDGDRMSVRIANEAPRPGKEAAALETDLARLARIMPPPGKPTATGSAKGWKALERRLGMTFPEDFKQFIGRYGAGEINGFIRIDNPFHFGNLDEYEKVVRRSLEAHRRLRKDDPKAWPYPAWPAAGGVFPLGSTANGDELLWRTTGKSGEWTVLLWSRGGDGFQDCGCGWTAFLRRLFEEDVQVGFWLPQYIRPVFTPSKPTSEKAGGQGTR
jgi:hypothetical protein